MAINQNKPNIDNLQEYLKSSSSGGGPKWWSIPSGVSSIRILPPWSPAGNIALRVFMHPIEFKDESMSYTKYNWTCVNKTYGKPCPICDGLQHMAAAGVDISAYEANRSQFYVNAIVMMDAAKKTSEGSHVVARIPKTMYDWIVSQITNPMIGDITDTNAGIDVFVTRTGTGLGTEYSMTLSPNGRQPIPPAYLDQITSLYDLDDIFSAGPLPNQVEPLLNHLKRSAGFIAAGAPQVAREAAGYAPQNYVQPPQQYNQTVPNQTYNPAPPFNVNTAQEQPSVAPSPFAGGASTAPQSTPTQQAPAVHQPPVGNNLPKCFGQYNAGEVQCVICPHEIACNKK